MAQIVATVRTVATATSQSWASPAAILTGIANGANGGSRDRTTDSVLEHAVEDPAAVRGDGDEQCEYSGEPDELSGVVIAGVAHRDLGSVVVQWHDQSDAARPADAEADTALAEHPTDVSLWPPGA